MTDQSPTTKAITPAEKRLLWLVRDLVAQNCWDRKAEDLSTAWDGHIPVFSGFISKHAEAIALLGEYGLVTDLVDNGGRVVSGSLLSLLDTAEVLKTGPFRDGER